MTNSKGRKLDEVLREVCEQYGEYEFTAKDIYKSVKSYPKKNGRKRHYTLTYSEVKQRLARAEYVEKVISDVQRPAAIYRNRRAG